MKGYNMNEKVLMFGKTNLSDPNLKDIMLGNLNIENFSKIKIIYKQVNGKDWWKLLNFKNHKLKIKKKCKI